MSLFKLGLGPDQSFGEWIQAIDKLFCEWVLLTIRHLTEAITTPILWRLSRGRSRSRLGGVHSPPGAVGNGQEGAANDT